MKKVLLLMLCCCPASFCFSWGFFAHRAINRLAVFTLPETMLGFYKLHIEFLTEHAVDPDKRRYSDHSEAPRHYIDMDYYETSAPVDTLPLSWKAAEARYSADTLNAYGIVPWHVNRMTQRLSSAFSEGNTDRILRISAELGHYIADACVPLHATMNYNGQMTGQHGIHGFWESRLPELFSDRYNLMTGRAVYIEHMQETIWDAVSGSFAAKDSVLGFERSLNTQFPPDRKYMLVQKGRTQVKTYSEAYASAYHEMLGGQVERRMRLAIRLVGSYWYTAWVNGGQPDLLTLPPPSAGKGKKKPAVQDGKMLGRQE